MQLARRLIARTAVALLLLVAGIGSSAANAGAAVHQPLSIHGGGHSRLSIREDSTGHITLNRSTLPAGIIRVDISSAVASQPESDPAPFQLFNGGTVAQLRDTMKVELDPKASPAQHKTSGGWLTQHLRGAGGSHFGGPQGEVYDKVFAAGTYYVVDFDRLIQGANPVSFRVTGQTHARLAATDQSLDMVSAGSGKLAFVVHSRNGQLHDGLLRITNRTSPDIHLAIFLPVNPGTTASQVLRALTGQPVTPNPFRSGSVPGLGPLSPNQSVNLHLKLGPGTYAVICPVSDDGTGMPHFLMGMILIVIVK